MLSNKTDVNSKKKILIIYIILILATLAVYWQVHKYDFVNLDDVRYVTENSHVQSGITFNELRWAFSTTHAEFWHPLTWLSLMLDYQIYGLKASGFHLTNLILHILSTLLLFWLFCRMTGAIWKSAFVAALFALHPMQVESVAWIAERKDVLSAFFWMLTLCLYIYYAEKQDIKRYLLVLFSFACALMSKPMVVTLPVVMILLDYWPLNRFESQKNNLILWQLKEKAPFFVLSAVFSIITLFAQRNPSANNFLLTSRLANAPVSFMKYLEKTFWPFDLAVFYPFADQLPLWQVMGSIMLIILISIAVIIIWKRLPYLFVGWSWYAITLLPVIGIIQVGDFAMADRYHYLSSIGIAVMMAWGIPSLINSEGVLKKISFPAGLVIITILAVLTWKQCGYWKNSIELFNHTILVTKDNELAHNNIAYALAEKGRIPEAIVHYNKALLLKPYSVNIFSNRGNAYARLGQYKNAVEDYNEAIHLKPDYAPAYINRGNAYTELGQYQMAIEDYNTALRLKPDYADTIYNNRGEVYNKLGQYRLALDDFSKTIRLNPVYIKAYNNRAGIYEKLGQYQGALENYNEVIRQKPDDASGYFNRGNAYIHLGQYEPAIKDFNQAIRLDPTAYNIYNNLGFIHTKLGQYKQAFEDYSKAILLKPDYTDAYRNRALIGLNLGDKISGCKDAHEACKLGDCSILKAAAGKGFCR